MRLKTAIFVVIVVFGPLLFVEGAVRLFFGSKIDGHMAFEQTLRDTKGRIFRRVERDGEEYYFSPILPTRYYTAIDFDRDLYIEGNRSPTSYRVFVLGGSSTAGSPFGHWASFSRFLQDALVSVARPDTKVEVINLGASGATSGRVRDILEKALFLQPDLVLVYSGHNEKNDIQGPTTYLRQNFVCAVERTAEWLEKHVVDYSYTYRGLLIAVSNTDWQGDLRRIARKCQARRVLVRDDTILDKVRSRFRTNITAIIKSSIGVGADVLLLSQPSNLLYQPGDFDNAPARQTQLVQELVDAFKRQNRRQYSQSKLALLDLDPTNPLVPFYDGLWALNDGEIVTAEDRFSHALARDRQPDRFSPEMGEILKDAARSAPGVDFIDVRGNIDALVPDGIIDGRLFTDRVHPTMELQRFIAQSVMDDYFLALRPRPNLFDYDRYVRSAIYQALPEEQYYGLTCRRYHKIEEWVDCVQEGLRAWRRTDDPAQIDKHRRAARIWENLYYFGRVNDAPEMVKDALAIFTPPRLARQ